MQSKHHKTIGGYFMKSSHFFIIGFLFFSAAIAQNINISGIVTDSNSIPIEGALISLLGQDMHDTVDVNGNYGFHTTTIAPNGTNVTENDFCIKNNIVFFSIKQPENILIELYNIRGQKVRTLIKNKFKKGIYSIPIAVNNLPLQLYLVRAKVGKEIKHAKFMNLYHNTGNDITINGQSPKTLAAVDTLLISADGYISMRLPIGIYDTTVDVTLIENSRPYITSIKQDTSVYVYSTIWFNAVANDYENNIVEYAWDYTGDGIFDYSDTSVSMAPYRYDTAGIYSAVLRVTDAHNEFVLDTVTITVSNSETHFEYINDDTIINNGGTVRCSISVLYTFDTITVEIDTANSGNWIIISNIETPGRPNRATAVKEFSTGSASNWDSVKVRVTADDSSLAIARFKVDIRPRPLTINSMDSTKNQITVNYSQTLENDFTEYRIYRDTTNNIDTNGTLFATITESGTSFYTSSDENYNFTRYYYAVYQFDSEGLISPISNIDSARIINTMPSAPIIVHPANDGDSAWVGDTLKWLACYDSNNHSIEYRVIVVDSAGNTVNRDIITGITDTFVVLLGFYDTTNITWNVIAYDSENDSSSWTSRTMHTWYGFPYLGQTGGYIFYDKGSYTNGWRFLEAAPYGWYNDGADPGVMWCNNGAVITGADSTAIGTGWQNTIDIENGCTTAGVAADICANLDINGYTDWFLPSKDELNLMYQNLKTKSRGEFGNYGYWSSSEVGGIGHAWYQVFTSGGQSTQSKNISNCVRAVRDF